MSAEPKKHNALDRLSWHWRNESGQLILDKYEIDHIFQYIRDLKDENTQLNDDLNDYEKEIARLKEKIDEQEQVIRNMTNKYNQLWHEVENGELKTKSFPLPVKENK